MTLVIALLPILTFAAVKSNPCAVINSAPEIDMTRMLISNIGLDKESIRSVSVELIGNNAIDDKLAEQFAEEDVRNYSNNEYKLSYSDFLSINKDNGAKNLIIKYTYKNKDGKEDVFIASSLVNDSECSIRFNGYITVKREF